MKAFQISFLTPLRGLAAVFTILFHANLYFVLLASPKYTGFFFKVWLVVDFFFILSSFVMTQVYAQVFEDKPNAKSYRSFVNLHLFKGDFINLLPGITAVKTGGHTPGQIALTIHSKKEQLLYISEAFLHPLHIGRLDWQTNYDLDNSKAKQSRSKLRELAYKENMLVNAFHFNFPGLRRIDKQQNKWIRNYTEK